VEIPRHDVQFVAPHSQYNDNDKPRDDKPEYVVTGHRLPSAYFTRDTFVFLAGPTAGGLVVSTGRIVPLA